jgi:hypothetical protein
MMPFQSSASCLAACTVSWDTGLRNLISCDHIREIGVRFLERALATTDLFYISRMPTASSRMSMSSSVKWETTSTPTQMVPPHVSVPLVWVCALVSCTSNRFRFAKYIIFISFNTAHDQFDFHIFSHLLLLFGSHLISGGVYKKVWIKYYSKFLIFPTGFVCPRDRRAP